MLSARCKPACSVRSPEVGPWWSSSDKGPDDNALVLAEMSGASGPYVQFSRDYRGNPPRSPTCLTLHGSVVGNPRPHYKPEKPMKRRESW